MYDCAQSALTFNNLNLPTYDIHAKQSRDQVLLNIHTMAQSFINISTKHIEKAKQQHDRINQLKQRILNCKNRISQFQSSNQALIFTSPSEYPKKYKFDPQKNVSIFKDYLVKTKLNKLDMGAHYILKHEIQKLGEESKLKLSQLNQFVVFLLGQLQGKKRTAFQRSLYPSKRKIQTLGNIPSNIQYIDSLIVFNSHINPYRKYEITSNVVEAQQQNKKKEIQDIDKNQILIDRQLVDYTKPQFQQESKMFIRQQKDLEMPTFDIDLDLDGIVTYDLNTQIDFMNQFADFDNVKKKNVATDPFSNSNKKDSQTSSNLSSSTSFSNANQSQFSSSSTPNLPPPPTLTASPGMLPPPPTLLPPPGMLPPPPLTGMLPPPPMLPPPSGMLPPPPTLLPPPSLSIPAAAKSGGGRNALLEELENPNPMARLKKVKTIEKGGVPPAKVQKQKRTGQTGENDSSQPTDPNIPVQDQKPRELSFMEALQAKIKSRFQALHADQDDDDD